MKIRCLIVDDESLARNGLEKYVKKIDFLQLEGVCKNAMEANSLINQGKIDLLFLDIHMPMLSGIDLLKSLDTPPKVIFTTAYSDFALQSFAFDVIDYLLKPISFERFLQASNKAFQRFSESRVAIERKVHDTNDDYFFIKTDKQLVKVLFEDILYVEAMQNYCRLHLADISHLTLVPLKKVIDMLPEAQFLQIHKSYAIGKSKVDAIIGNQVVIGNAKLPIGRSMREDVMSQLIGKNILKR